MTDPALRLENVEFTYEGTSRPILRGVNLEISRGEFAVIAGPSGVGKSTLCRTINNIIPVFYRGTLSGNRIVSGDSLHRQKISSLAKNVGMVFQDFEQQLFSTNTSLELTFAMENFGIAPSEMQQRIKALLEHFQISHLVHREPFSLSGGEKQKLAIASVLIYGPRILILDEPTTDLDPDSKEFVMTVLPRLKEWVETVVIVDHESDQFHSADRIFLMQNGKMEGSGSPGEILTNPDLLLSTSLAPLDLISLQAKLGRKPELKTPKQLAESMAGYSLNPIPGVERSQSPVVVDVDQITFSYPERNEEALRNVSLQIRKGEFVGIVGRNGSGKSTLLRLLNGLHFPQKGAIRVLGKDVTKWSRKELSRIAGLVFQNPDHQIFNSTVRSEIEFGPLQFQFPENQIKENVDRAIQTMDLTEQSDRDPFQLSKGERQRVAVASVLSVMPEILMLDEPTTGLDHKQQTFLMELLRELNRNGSTIIVVTHSLKIVGDFCSYAFLMQKGQVVAEGHPRKLFLRNDLSIKRPPLWELVRLIGGNALTVEEFMTNLVRAT